VYRGDAPGGPGNVDAFGEWLGRPARVAAAFEATKSWQDIEGMDWQLGPWSRWVHAQAGRALSLGVALLPERGASLAQCSAGEYDGSWAKLARNLARHGLEQAYLRLGWEMDGPWNAWAAPPGSGQEAHFAGCFRRAVDAMRRAVPQNRWRFVWNVTTTDWKPSYLETIWPGDSHVDVVAIDVYDQSWAPGSYPYPGRCDAACRAERQDNAWRDQLARLQAVRDFARAHGKPLALPEWGAAIRADGHGGGDNAAFVRRMHEVMVDRGNNVEYHCYWDVATPELDAQLSGATRFPASAEAFRRLFGPQRLARP
jgi:hypothetical protein